MGTPGAAGATAGFGVVIMVVDPGEPLRPGLVVPPECPEPDEFPLPVAKPRKPWASALDAKVKTTTRTVTGAARNMLPPNY